jgi:glycerol uptake facilitator-like aquaporin
MQDPKVAATAAPQPTAGAPGQTMLGSVTASAANTGRMVAGQITGRIDSALDELDYKQYRSSVLVECFGSFALCLTVSLGQTSVGVLSPVAVGFMYAALIFTFGYISGGHFNPAVTFGMWLSRDKPTSLVWHKALLYWIFQVLGATLGSFYCLMVHGPDFAVPTTPDTFYPGIFRILITEAVFTFVLVSVMLHVATSKQKENSFHGFAIGMSVMAACLANNGGVLNPATATALIIVKCFTGSCIPVLHLWVFWTGELLGCIFAAIFYNVASATLQEQEDQEKRQKEAETQMAAATRQQNALRAGDAPQDVGQVATYERDTPRHVLATGALGAPPAGGLPPPGQVPFSPDVELARRTATAAPTPSAGLGLRGPGPIDIAPVAGPVGHLPNEDVDHLYR